MFFSDSTYLIRSRPNTSSVRNFDCRSQRRFQTWNANSAFPPRDLQPWFVLNRHELDSIPLNRCWDDCKFWTFGPFSGRERNERLIFVLRRYKRICLWLIKNDYQHSYLRVLNAFTRAAYRLLCGRCTARMCVRVCFMYYFYNCTRGATYKNRLRENR